MMASRPQHGKHSVSTMFVNSQRPPTGSHLSAWLHGDSTVVRHHLDSKSKPTGMRKAMHTRSVTAPVQRHRGGDLESGPVPLHRSRASTNSILNITDSSNPAIRRPASTSNCHPPRSRYNSSHPAFAGGAMPPSAGTAVPAPTRASGATCLHQHRPQKFPSATYEKQLLQQRQHQHQPRPMCFPGITDRKIRQKSIGTLVSGTLLTLVLTICE